jgi:glycosyltransferase involved in cell wall biosynthesis
MPSIENGGVEKNLFIISNYLIQHYKKISIITLSKKYKNRFNKKIKFVTLNSNFWDNLGRRKKFLICIFLLIVEIFKGNSVVFSFQGNIYSTLICKLLFTKIIVRSNSSPIGWSNTFLKKLFYKLILNLADRTIVNSKNFKKQLKSKYNLDSICIYNPLNVKEILLLSKKKDKYNYFKKGFLNIITVARFSTQKDYPTLIKALKKIKSKIKFKAVFVGGGDQLIKIKNLISENNLEDDIKIINGEKNPFPIIKKSDLFILSSKFEGLPNVILEALSLNKFIISSNCPTGPAEILDNGKGGLLFNVGNHKELAKQIVYFKKNKNICKAKLNYARKRLFRFDYKLNLNNYKKIIDKLII